ncbi:dTMP kinase [Tuanshanicoccus lijuaniae]|uniref:dTMP kinase n=1 Tax=Aerococcaceae bacterium zg-1292 TaxID=2774330 RepID=UPI001BD82C32|nr:dTMP kinase [Aerococcaceae bacterium zg-BR22]MBS4456127.1 dTMP kinase [Aerococcaceae bacterium zg-A91]MBS4457978.1 dTMP kinase [Aerococcaceae bacterium zg-BR33]
MNQGYFITFEGPEGAGKTTVIQLLVEKLKDEGYPDIVVTREPGGSHIAEQIRTVILDCNNTLMDKRTEALLFAAARRQHLVEVVLPALEQGKIVLCDRFIDSSLAYQGLARDIEVEKIWDINQFAIEGTLPDLTLLIDVPAEIGLERIHQSRKDEKFDRLDQEALTFHQQVREAFLSLAKEYARIKVIDGTQVLEDVVQHCMDYIQQQVK